MTVRVEQLGEGEPELAILGGIHGDEPCGVQAIETLLDADPDVERPVKCIIANERALERNVRYVEADMNRVFPGDSTAETYERRLAAALLEELRGCTTLSMHSTQSYSEPFAIVEETGPVAERICPALSIDAIVEVGPIVENALVGYVDVVEVECGLQGTQQAAANAEQLVREFLTATGALAGPETPDQPEHAVPVYRLQHHIPKEPAADSYAVHVDNFERVDEGTTYATIDDTDLIAEEPFYPVLMSPYGYKSQLGYVGTRTRTLADGTQASDREPISEEVSAR